MYLESLEYHPTLKTNLGIINVHLPDAETAFINGDTAQQIPDGALNLPEATRNAVTLE